MTQTRCATASGQTRTPPPGGPPTRPATRTCHCWGRPSRWSARQGPRGIAGRARASPSTSPATRGASAGGGGKGQGEGLPERVALSTSPAMKGASADAPAA
eukprot:356185-Chlamydomonas_euryale.AAC.2